MKLSSLIVLAFLLSFQALADQCEWNTRSNAQKARVELVKHNHYFAFCEPCGDTVPALQFIREDLGKKKAKDGKDVHFSSRGTKIGQDNRTADYWGFTINGSYGMSVNIDLAYVFVPTANGEYKNLAKIVGCPASGVSDVIDPLLPTEMDLN